MKSIERLKDILCEELEKISKKGELSAGSLDVIHKLTDTIKNIDKIEMYEEYTQDDDSSYDVGASYRRGRGRNARRDSKGRYSSTGGHTDEGYSEDHRMFENNPSYERNEQDGVSYRRGRISYDGYSRDSAKDYMIDKIEDMMREADPKSKEALKRCIKQIENA